MCVIVGARCTHTPNAPGLEWLIQGRESSHGFKPSICSHVYPWSKCSSSDIIEDCPVCSAYVCRGHSSFLTLQNISGFSDSLSPSVLPLVANPNGELVARDSPRKIGLFGELTILEQSYNIRAKPVRCVLPGAGFVQWPRWGWLGWRLWLAAGRGAEGNWWYLWWPLSARGL